MSKSSRREIEQSERIWIDNGFGDMERIRGFGSFEVFSTPTRGVNIVNFYGFDQKILTTTGAQVYLENKPRFVTNESPVRNKADIFNKKWKVTHFPQPEYSREIHQAATRDLLEKLDIATLLIPNPLAKGIFHSSKIVEVCLDPNGSQTTINWLNAHKKIRTTQSQNTQYLLVVRKEPKQSSN